MAKDKEKKKTADNGVKPNELKLGEAKTQKVKLTAITANTAQSRGMGVMPHLTDRGHGIFEKIATDKEAVWPLLVSSKASERRLGAELITQSEPNIVEFARKIRHSTQLQPIGVITDGDNEFDIIFGMRRALAAAYNYAMYGETEPQHAEIEAKVFSGKLKRGELRLIALNENNDREDESPIDRAITYKALKEEDKMDSEKIAHHIGKSGQHVREHLKLLAPCMEPFRLKIHEGKMTLRKALEKYKVLSKGGKEGGGDRNKDNDDSSKRYKMYGTKKLIAIYNSERKPKKMEEDEWALFILDDVRRFLAYKLGLEFSTYVDPGPEEKLTKVNKERGIRLLIACGMTDAREWPEEKIADHLTNIVNHVEEDKTIVESDALDKLLDKLRAGYKEGNKVQIVTKGKKGKKKKKKTSAA